eukprot:TRINITY_DN1921_c0_g1_i1.p1 TRINITY_DN1921_c0_g1~~TRINITY_DN1921_c0_g1_i1.p1  ORF type:complete len:1655 (-),score=516.28 TRINITY_DN1921_c0_g1_i1:5-4474(-)
MADQEQPAEHSMSAASASPDTAEDADVASRVADAAGEAAPAADKDVAGMTGQQQAEPPASKTSSAAAQAEPSVQETVVEDFKLDSPPEKSVAQAQRSMQPEEGALTPRTSAADAAEEDSTRAAADAAEDAAVAAQAAAMAAAEAARIMAEEAKAAEKAAEALETAMSAVEEQRKESDASRVELASLQDGQAVSDATLREEEARLRAIVEAEMKLRDAEQASEAERQAIEQAAVAAHEAAEEEQRLRELETEREIQRQEEQEAKQRAEEEQQALQQALEEAERQAKEPDAHASKEEALAEHDLTAQDTQEPGAAPGTESAEGQGQDQTANAVGSEKEEEKEDPAARVVGPETVEPQGLVESEQADHTEPALEEPSVEAVTETRLEEPHPTADDSHEQTDPELKDDTADRTAVQDPAAGGPSVEMAEVDGQAVSDAALQQEEARLRAIVEAEMKLRVAEQASEAERRAIEQAAVAAHEAAEEEEHLRELETEREMQRQQEQEAKQRAEEEQQALQQALEEQTKRQEQEEEQRQKKVQEEEQRRKEAEEQARLRALAHEEARLQREAEAKAQKEDEQIAEQELERKREQLRQAAEEESRQREEEEQRRRHEAAQNSARQREANEQVLRERASAEERRQQEAEEKETRRLREAELAQTRLAEAQARSQYFAEEAAVASARAHSARQAASEASSRASSDTDVLGRLLRQFVNTAHGTFAHLSGVPPRDDDLDRYGMPSWRSGYSSSAPSSRGPDSAREVTSQGEQEQRAAAPVVPRLWDPHPRSEEQHYGWRAPSNASVASESQPPSGASTRRDERDEVPVFVPQPESIQSGRKQVLKPSAESPGQRREVHYSPPERFSSRSKDPKDAAEEDSANKENLPVFVPASARSGRSGYVPEVEKERVQISPRYASFSPPPMSSRSSSEFLEPRDPNLPVDALVDPSIIAQLCSLLNPPQTPPGEDDRLRRGPMDFSARSTASARPYADGAISALVLMPELSRRTPPSGDADDTEEALLGEVTVATRPQQLDPNVGVVSSPSSKSETQVAQETVPAVQLSPVASPSRAAESASRVPSEVPVSSRSSAAARPVDQVLDSPATRTAGDLAVDTKSSARSQLSSARSARAEARPSYQPPVRFRAAASEASSPARSGSYTDGSDYREQVPTLPLRRMQQFDDEADMTPGRSSRSSENGFGDAFGKFSHALFQGADAILDSSRSGSSAASRRSWERPRPAGPRALPVVDTAMLALGQSSTWGLDRRERPEEEAGSEAELTDRVFTGRTAGSRLSSVSKESDSLEGLLAFVQPSLPTAPIQEPASSSQGGLSQELLGGMNSFAKKPSEAELMAMAGRIATAKRMPIQEEIQVRNMLRDIANALFGAEEATATPAVAAAASSSMAVGGDPLASGILSGSHTARSLHTARSSVRSQHGEIDPETPHARAIAAGGNSGADSPSTAMSSVRSSIASGSGSRPSEPGMEAEALDEEVQGLLGELYGNLLG